MRTAVRKEVTSFGTFLSTLCHEFCHHLDFQKFGFRDSWHTRRFYERPPVLYRHAGATPLKKLFWVPILFIEHHPSQSAPGSQGTHSPSVVMMWRLCNLSTHTRTTLLVIEVYRCYTISYEPNGLRG